MIQLDFSLKLAKICKEHNKSLFASSCSVYGASKTKNLLNENLIPTHKQATL